jgi:hypothetical protein
MASELSPLSKIFIMFCKFGDRGNSGKMTAKNFGSTPLPSLWPLVASIVAYPTYAHPYKPIVDPPHAPYAHAGKLCKDCELLDGKVLRQQHFSNSVTIVFQ